MGIISAAPTSVCPALIDHVEAKAIAVGTESLRDAFALRVARPTSVGA